MRYLSISKSLKRSSFEPTQVFETEKTPLTLEDDHSTITSSHTPLPPPNLKIKKVDHFYSRWSKKWKYQNSGSNAIPEAMALPIDGKDDPWQNFCFVVVRTMPRREDQDIQFQIVVKSPYLLKACKDVIADVQGVSWNVVPLKLNPILILSFLPQFQAYMDKLKAKANPSEEVLNMIATVEVLFDYFRKDYRATLSSIENLTSHGEITFDLLYAIMVPRTIMVMTNPVTRELQALQLATATKIKTGGGMDVFELILEGIDVDDTAYNIKAFARTQSRMILVPFAGTVKITSLDVYPLRYHPQEAEIRQTLLNRGRKWTNFAHGVHHMHYSGMGAFRRHDYKILKYNVASRVMIDRGNFRKYNPNYAYPLYKVADQPAPEEDGQWPPLPPLPPQPPLPPLNRPPQRTRNVQQGHHFNIPLQVQDHETWKTAELTEEELLIASPVVYGFSLSDKLWLELNVENIKDVEWNKEAFSNLVLPSNMKTLLQSLVEVHNSDIVFDDFIKGKGRGLVVNFFGPPGVGKTLSAEATSEHVKQPLYVVGAGDLGTTAAELDQELQRVFELATSWKAIVLIDEADVFLEARSLHDLERNAMVAVFLRHLEYYPAILFLTTNRVKTFDEAFLSRIHVALNFPSLSVEARRAVWTAFLTKAGVKIAPHSGVSQEELNKLIQRNINGRQVKNATKTASSLALSRGERLCYRHLNEVLDVMNQFETEFENMKKALE